MIFLTVGSSLPFDRLVRLIDEIVAEGIIKEKVFAQIGDGIYEPQTFEYERFLSKDRFDAHFEKASMIVSHAGIGTISLSLAARKPILVMPRSKSMRELVDDHQSATARKFADLGHVLAFSNRNELLDLLSMKDNFRPLARNPNVLGVSDVVGDFLSRLVAVC